MIESDHRVVSEEAVPKRLKELVRHLRTIFTTSLTSLKRARGVKLDDGVLDLPVEVFGRPRAPAGTWGSCIRIVDPIEVHVL